MEPKNWSFVVGSMQIFRGVIHQCTVFQGIPVSPLVKYIDGVDHLLVYWLNRDKPLPVPCSSIYFPRM